MSAVHERRGERGSVAEDEQFYAGMLVKLHRGSEIVTHLLTSQRLTRDEYPTLVRLTEGFRWVLDQHLRSRDGRCHRCPRTWLGRRPRWPCSVVRAIRGVLTD